jgi:UDP-N-acetylglucosamine 4,6-dehydratase/5-epimerase
MKNIKNILITGGTGSFGKNFAHYLLNKYPNIKKLVIFSRDELKQSELKLKLAKDKNFNKLRFFLGDVRDLKRLYIAFRGIDLVIHAAALKQVDTAEYNPTEYINTNIIGSQNVIEAAFYNNVKKVIALSTDKASSPINLYGATKLCSDKLFISSNNFYGQRKFIVVRYGNVAASRGSVIPLFLNQLNSGNITLTHKDMTRFNLTLNKSFETVMWAVNNCIGGEILVPKIPSFKVTDLIKAMGKNLKVKIIGMRQGEKLHEEMISNHDSGNTIDMGKYYIILPHSDLFLKKHYLKENKSKNIKKEFSYNSKDNVDFMSVKDLQNLIKKIKSDL